MAVQKIWRLKPPSPEASRLASKVGIRPLQAQLLINRGVTSPAEANAFLNPTLAGIKDPWLLSDMDVAVERIMDAIDNRLEIIVYGDYDVDGLTSAALLCHFFSSIGIPASFYIPHRLREGYGLSKEALRKMAQKDRVLLITVDCGISNMEEIALAQELGMKVVVTDHHQVPADFHPICPVVNPKRDGTEPPFGDLAGVGVAFYLAIALRAALRERDWFKTIGEPDLRTLLALVALGTVADMCPLLGQNRILVKRGIDSLRGVTWPGLKALQDVAGMDGGRMATYDLSFRLAPRLNAPGRIGSAETGMKLLMTDQVSEARDLAREIDAMNGRRQVLEADILDQIEESIVSEDAIRVRRSLVFHAAGWHIGVLGIVASKIREQYHRPVLVAGIHDGVASGSGRSIKGFNLYKALADLSLPFKRFGGHESAVGFSLDAADIGDLKQGLEMLALARLGEDDLHPVVEADGQLTLSELDLETVEALDALAPFGPGNPEPIFRAHSVNVMDAKVVGGRHLKLRVRQGGTSHAAIGFGMADLATILGGKVEMLITPMINEWQGCRRVQLKVVDIRPSQSTL
jgi:single-stranded-DNA-specific exonuclease